MNINVTVSHFCPWILNLNTQLRTILSGTSSMFKIKYGLETQIA